MSLFGSFVLLWWLYPYHRTIALEEVRSEQPVFYYLPLHNEPYFQINYIHSIHLSNVKEQYKVTDENKMRFEYMQYEDVAIGLPGYAEQGETLELLDGVYKLTFSDRVIDSFVLYVGKVNTDLSLRYEQQDYHLKDFLQKGQSYDFRIAKVSKFTMGKGVRLDGKQS